MITLKLLKSAIIAHNGDIEAAVKSLGGVFEIGDTGPEPLYQLLYASFGGQKVGSRIKIAMEYKIPESEDEWVKIMMWYEETAEVYFKTTGVKTYTQTDQ